MRWYFEIFTFTGYNFTFWVVMGIIRFFSESLERIFPTRSRIPMVSRLTHRDVAVILAAHNEELALPATLAALKKNVSAHHIYVGSDASNDQTVAIAQAAGCKVLDLQPNRGKAKMLVHLLRHFNLLARYKAILIMDAEVVVSDTYLADILPYFDDPNVAAFVSHAHARWVNHWLPRWSMFFTAYRIRLWCLLYYGLRYGQTWKYSSMTPIVPGGSSVYRTSALAKIEIDTPGLIIEDFHMTFQIHHKRLGRIASHPKAYIIDQEPYSFRDYYRQVYRWFLGFWQTYLLHGFWPSFFWLATTAFLVEMFFYSLVILSLPLVAAALILNRGQPIELFVFRLTSLSLDVVTITALDVLITILLIDLALTAIVAAIEKKPIMVVYGLLFFLLRYVDTLIFLWTLPVAIFSRSEGRWVSPARQQVDA